MAKVIDLTGQKFGRLTIIKRVENPSYVKDRKNSYWLCRCDCGNEKIICGNNMKRKATLSCGCYSRETTSRVRLNNLTGKRFGKLVVIKRVNNTNGNRPRWLCKCDCGNEAIVAGADLASNSTRSCGCYKIERISLPDGQASINKVLYAYRQKAKERNIPFELSKEEFLNLTKQNCFYCEKEPSNIKKNNNHGNFIYNGIDRIDSKKGYTRENTVPCCSRCNEAKMAETQSDFFEWIKTVYNNLSDKGLI